LTDGPTPAEPPPAGRRFRFDQPFAAGVILAQMLWLQGCADQASAVARQRLSEASRTGHSISVCDALAQAVCPIALWVGDLSALAEAVDMLRARTADQVLGPWSILGRCWEGALLMRRDGPEAGLAALQSAVEELEHVRFGFYHTGFLACLADGLAASGSIAHGLTVIERALEQCTRREELWCLAELLRVKGEILLRGGTPDRARAEQQFVHAVECARRQGELAWELRATTSLARLRQQTGNGRDALDALASVYARFGEGFATADLIAARALLDARS
jgi:predicted ATPase